MRTNPSNAPNAKAPAAALRRAFHPGNSNAAETRKNPTAGSPAGKEQLLRHWSLGTKAGEKRLSPPNPVTWAGRARPQWPSDQRVTARPGPSARANNREIPARRFPGPHAKIADTTASKPTK